MEVSDQEREMRSRADYNIINNSINTTVLGSGRVPAEIPAATDQLQEEDDVDHLGGPDPTKQAAATLRKPTTVGDTAAVASVRYLECHRNHAASLGGLVLDGCREFMQGSGEDGSPESMRCAACNCHRNFHRKDDADTCDGAAGAAAFYSRRATAHQPLHLPPPQLPSPIYLHQQQHQHQHQHQKIMLPAGTALHHAQPMSMVFGCGGAESSSEEANAWQMRAAAGAASSNKKRFRTKFTQEQKQKMVEFAEKVGWRIQNQDEKEIQSFCAEVGVRRQVFKVWIHNNKNSLKHHNDSCPDDDQHQHDQN